MISPLKVTRASVNGGTFVTVTERLVGEQTTVPGRSDAGVITTVAQSIVQPPPGVSLNTTAS